MFYLINQKDGLFDQSILVNGLNLKSIEVSTGDDNYDVIFTHLDDDNTTFSFVPESIFNVDQVIHEISQLKPPVYFNDFIVVTDIDNIENIQDRFGHNSQILGKATTILININEINLVYEENDQFIINTSHKNFTIQESPEAVLNLIKFKIVPEETPVLDSKTQWKTKL